MSPEEQPWGRVDDDGTVFVRTADGERPVGQWPGGDPAEALALYTRRYDGLALEVGLLERRVRTGAVSPDDATKAVQQVRSTVVDAQAVGDLDALVGRLDALAPLIAEQRDKRRAAKAEKVEEARVAKERIAAEAERIAAGTDWKGGADRLRELLDEWKTLPRLERALDDTLWKRFSSARTTYTRQRKQHFAELHESRDQARAVKEKLVVEAEALADSTDWGATAGAYRDLMRRWKAAGPAPRGVDDRLWKRFRAAQDQFFGARDADNAKIDAEYAANADVKREILVDAEALLPITDVDAARRAWRDIADRWDEAGKVPRDQMQELEARIRKVESAIAAAGEAEWERTNPEARARADATVTLLEKSIADLEAQRAKAEAKGDARRVREADEAIEARRSWLAEAQKALTEFTR